jgi:hypothetical protein
VNPETLLDELDHRGVIEDQDLLVVGSDVFRVSEGSVTPVSHLPGSTALDSDPAIRRLLLQVYDDSYLVVDLTDGANPKLSAPVQHSQSYAAGKLGGDYLRSPVLVRTSRFIPSSGSPASAPSTAFPPARG